LWATRKIGYLLNQVRLTGADAETIDQIVKLSIRYGIVTPYTSYLVTEDMALGAAAQESLADQELERLNSQPAAPAYGQAAVERAAEQGQLREAGAPASLSGEAVGRVKIVAARTFVLNAGVWTDTAFDPAEMTTVKVPFLSADYFALSAARPDLAAAFALGPQVIALADGVAYQVVSAQTPAEPVAIPPTAAPLATQSPTTMPVATPTAAIPPTAASSNREKTPGGLPCAGALLPLLLPLAVFRPRRPKP